MKTILRALMLGILLTAFTAAPSFAQDPQTEKTALYEKYTKNYAGTIEQKKIAVAAAQEYIEKYGANADDKQQVDYFKTALPPLQKAVADEEKRQAGAALYERFNTAAQGGNWDNAYAGGKDILAKYPDDLDVMIFLGSVGYDEALKNPANNKYNADTINYAKMAIQNLEGGKTTQNYGVYRYTFSGDKAFPNAKENTLGWLNYNVGYLMYFSQNQKKEAVPYLYKATQFNGTPKTFPIVYQAIGASYFDEAKRLSQESENMAKAAGDQDTEQSKAAYAMAKGYADRAIDAYARAYKVAGANPGTKKEYKDGLYKVLQDLYKFRYNGKTDGLDAFVATVMNKPFVNPTTVVTPVVETTTTTTTTAKSSMSGATNTTVDAAPTAGMNNTTSKTTVKTTTTGTNGATTKTTTKTKTTVKTPAPKKKGTR
ncbi:MAG: hypothetical protein H0U87_06300 [Acidobacteria bacterium]|jgi:hypothetical protein|nr:hypothetical protein [Acidobacteriota bacterium]